MESVALAFTKLPVLGPTGLFDRRRRPPYPFLPVLARRRGGARAAGRAGFPVAAFGRGSGEEASRSAPKTVLEKLGMQDFASMSSSSGNMMFAASGNPQPLVPPPSSAIGSPLFWIGVGVGLSALFSMVAARVKSYMMQQAFKTMMGQMTPQNGQFNNGPNFSGSFPFPAASQASPTASQQMQTPVASQPVVTVDVAATEVKKTPTEASDHNEPTGDPEKYAFVDVSPTEELQKDPYLTSEKSREVYSMKDIHLEKEVSPNGVSVKKDVDAFHEQSQSRKSESLLSVEALEKMMEDPTVQKMVYPYLPEEMRNPATFKSMLQNPQYRQQLHDMLNNMGGSSEWDNRMMESMKNFDLSSPEVKQQFEQIGLTPEEVISKVMSNPEIAMAFQNPKVQAAIMDCSQNPLSIAKYQNDQEVMDVFKKISEIFPGVTGYP